MSETTESQTSGFDEAPGAGASETEAPASAEHGAAPDERDAEAEREREHKQSLRNTQRRIDRLTAKVSSVVQENERLQYMLRQSQVRPTNGEAGQLDEATVQRLRAEWDAEQERKAWVARRDAFHEKGEQQYRDWRQRCDSLIANGADDGLSALLVELPDGPKVVAALADDQDELDRIAKLKSQTARAAALGEYAAKLVSKPEPNRGVSRAPAPIRPINARAAPQFNEYDPNNTTQTLVQFYAKQAQDAFKARNTR